MKCSFNIGGKSRIYIAPVANTLPKLLPDRRVVVISDGNVDRLQRTLLSRFETILIGSGETIKTMTTVESICRRLIEMGADRSTFILGIGGGVISDIAGFVASTYMRGVEFGFVPTTLLAQVDAAVGGKNGVNIDGYKNMIGTFTQPQFVVCDPALLRTLPDREFRAGLAEAIKAGIIGDAALFERLEQTPYEVLRTDETLLAEVVREAVSVKAAIVCRDERESDERRKLNLGHTFAHAIEKSTSRLNHGEAVAVGTALMAQAAVKLGRLSASDCNRIVQMLEKQGFILTPPVDMKRMLRDVAKDKKSHDGHIRVVLPTGIGACVLHELTLDELEELFR